MIFLLAIFCGQDSVVKAKAKQGEKPVIRLNIRLRTEPAARLKDTSGVVWVSRLPDGVEPTRGLPKRHYPIIHLGKTKHGKPRFFPVQVPTSVTIRSHSSQFRGLQYRGTENKLNASAVVFAPMERASLKLDEPELFPVRVNFAASPDRFHYVMPLTHEFYSVFSNNGVAELNLPQPGDWEVRLMVHPIGLLTKQKARVSEIAQIKGSRFVISVRRDRPTNEAQVFLKLPAPKAQPAKKKSKHTGGKNGNSLVGLRLI